MFLLYIFPVIDMFLLWIFSCCGYDPVIDMPLLYSYICSHEDMLLLYVLVELVLVSCCCGAKLFLISQSVKYSYKFGAVPETGGTVPRNSWSDNLEGLAVAVAGGTVVAPDGKVHIVRVGRDALGTFPVASRVLRTTELISCVAKLFRMTIEFIFFIQQNCSGGR
jgi:hypothetical protein